MKKIFTFFTAALFAASLWAGEVKDTIPSKGTSLESYNKVPLNVASKYSLTQFIYLSSEITDKTNANLSKISFYADASGEYTRKLGVYVQHTTNSDLSSGWIAASGSPVFVGNVAVPNGGWFDIPLSAHFTWNKSSNILITIVDSTGSTLMAKNYKVFSAKSARSRYSGGSTQKDPKNPSGIYDAINNVPQVILTFVSDGPSFDEPTNVDASNITSSGATISWTKPAEATSIKLQYVKNGETDTTTINGISASSYAISDLSAETKYDYKVYAVYSAGISAPVAKSFTTAAAPAPSDHVHDGITFAEWTATDALPTSAGNYYLKNNVSVSSWTVPTGDTKICLNGKTISYSGSFSISLASGKNLFVYDNEGNGVLTSANGNRATIKVNGGSLSLMSGSISNTGSGTDGFAVDVTSGVFNVKGDVKLSTASAANVFLRNNGSVITLVGVMTNSTKLSVSKAANLNITSGWSTQMGSADPANFFSSKNTDAPAVILVGSEAQLGVPSVTISETGDNTIENNKLTDVNLVRTFQANILNTIALPFALDNDELVAAFGADYELYELSSSSLSAGVLSLFFDKVTALEFGKPYLLRISSEVKDPSFSSVTLKTATQSVKTTAVTMMPVINAKELDGNEGNLFLNASGELNWSTSKALFKGMRAYFRVDNPSAVSVRRISLGTNAATDLDNLEVSDKAVKRIVNGQLVIERNGIRYDLNGQIIKMTK